MRRSFLAPVVQGVNLDRCAGTLHCTDVLKDLDVWDPDRTLQKLKKTLHDLRPADSTNHLVVVDSLSYIATALGESSRRTVQLTQALTSMVRIRPTHSFVA